MKDKWFAENNRKVRLMQAEMSCSLQIYLKKLHEAFFLCDEPSGIKLNKPWVLEQDFLYKMVLMSQNFCCMRMLTILEEKMKLYLVCIYCIIHESPKYTASV
jgi:hypothetical protein